MEVKSFIFSHLEFIAFNQKLMKLFTKWRKAIAPRLLSFDQHDHPKELIETVSETLLAVFQAAPLLDAYDVYQHLMDYWTETILEVARAYAISRLSWIRAQQKKLAEQPRETPRWFIERESHYLWGRRHLLSIIEREVKSFIALDHKRITLTVRPASDFKKRAEVIHEWHQSLLHWVVPGKRSIKHMIDIT